MATNQFAEGSILQIQVVDVVDAAGHPATLASAPTWASSDDTVLTVIAAPDGLSATGTLAKTGTVTITATSDGLSASVAITGIAGQAVSFQLAVSIAAPTQTA